MTGARPPWRSRWWMPAWALFLGALILCAFAIGDDLGSGLKSFGVLAAVAALFAFGGRSETLQGIGGPARDERWAMIDLRASFAAGMAVLLVASGAWLYEIADGREGSPYGQLMAVGGAVYVLAVLVLRRRS